MTDTACPAREVVSCAYRAKRTASNPAWGFLSATRER